MTIEQHPVRAKYPMYRDQHLGNPLPTPVAPSVPGGAPPMSGFAVSALVWGLLGLVTFGLGALGGVICGPIALRETRFGARGGYRLAVVALSISWIQIAGWFLFGVVMLFASLLRTANL